MMFFSVFLGATRGTVADFEIRLETVPLVARHLGFEAMGFKRR